MERAIIQAAVAGVTREVTIERLTPNHCWFAVDARVVIRFPTGGKEHVHDHPALIEREGRWEVSVSGFRNSNRCRVLRWADDKDFPSGWGTG